MLRGGVCGAGIKFSPFGTLATILAAFAVGAGTSQAIFGAASGHEFGDFFGSYFESFEDAFVHLGMSCTIVPNHPIIRTRTRSAPIEHIRRTRRRHHIKRGPQERHIHSLPGHSPILSIGNIHLFRDRVVSHHLELLCRLVCDPLGTTALINFDEDRHKVSIRRGVDDTGNGRFLSVYAFENRFDEFDTVCAGDSGDGHGYLYIPVFGYEYDRCFVDITVLWIVVLFGVG